MKKPIVLAILAVSALFLYVSCKKNENKTPQKSPTELLTNNSSKQWLTTSMIDGGQEIIEECDKDDVYTFYADKRIIIDYNVKCDSTDADQDAAYWDFNNVQNKLKVISFGDTSEVNIDVLTETKLVISDGSSFSQTFRAK